MCSASREYFDDLGADWDLLQRRFFSERVRRAAISRAEMRAGELAADVGAGTGFLSEALIEAGMRVVAVDQSAAMLDALRSKLPFPERIDTRVGEAGNLPIDTASVDCVFANMYLHHVPDPLHAIEEMVRILKPSGRLVVTDLVEHEFEFLRTEHHDHWLGFERGIVWNWLRCAGLEEVKVNCLDECCEARSEDGLAAAIRIFIAVGAKPGV